MDEITLLRNIAQAACLMRNRQKNYFAARRKGDQSAASTMLQLSKSAEAQLDNLLTEHAAGNHTDQSDLFTDPAQPP